MNHLFALKLRIQNHLNWKIILWTAEHYHAHASRDTRRKRISLKTEQKRWRKFNSFPSNEGNVGAVDTQIMSHSKKILESNNLLNYRNWSFSETNSFQKKNRMKFCSLSFLLLKTIFHYLDPQLEESVFSTCRMNLD